MLLCSAVHGHALAQTPSRAETLFNEGLESMRAGKYEQACPALTESHRLDPLPGVLFTVAECEAAWGRIATALSHYDEFLRVLTTLAPPQQKKHQERRQIAVEKMSALAKLAPQLTIVMPPGAPPGLIIKKNGETVEALKYNVAIAVDPGTYVITFDAPGKPTQERRVQLAKAQNATLGADVTFGSDSKPQEPMVVSTAKPDRTLAWIVGGVGVAGLALGGVTGALTLGKKSTIEDECPEHQCSPKGRDAVDSARTTGLISTIGFGVGIAGVATSAILLLTAKPTAATPQKKASVRPLVTAHPAGAFAGIYGSF